MPVTPSLPLTSGHPKQRARCLTATSRSALQALLLQQQTYSYRELSTPLKYIGVSTLVLNYAHNPKRLAFPIASVTQSEPDSEGKFPFWVTRQKKWISISEGVPALPPREERLFTVSFGSLKTGKTYFV